MYDLDNSVFIIFGITGDLAKRKLLPALYNLASKKLLPKTFKIVGVSRQETSVLDIVNTIKKSISKNIQNDVLDFLSSRIEIVNMDISNPDTYYKLAKTLEDSDKEAGCLLNRLFYLAIPSSLFETVITRLSKNDLNHNEEKLRFSRFLIEKPFGYNLTSAKKLIKLLDSCFKPSQIFRIDHYLAKETAQNILAFRFENPLFNGVWNNKHISHILVTASEKIGIEGRTNFYEKMGAMRDLVQSHLLQLVALITMDEPEKMNAKFIHKNKEKLLSKIKTITPDLISKRSVRGQYNSYKYETGLQDSNTETYAALWLEINSKKWQGVPILIRTGKALAKKVTEITIVFNENPLHLQKADKKRKNCLTFRIQPDEGIAIDFTIKKPGFENKFERVQLDFCYEGMEEVQTDAYKRVLFDALRGDSTLFATDKEVLECWRITEPVIDAWEKNLVPLVFYENGSTGPKEANELAKRANARWLPSSHTVCQSIKTKPRD